MGGAILPKMALEYRSQLYQTGRMRHINALYNSLSGVSPRCSVKFVSYIFRETNLPNKDPSQVNSSQGI